MHGFDFTSSTELDFGKPYDMYDPGIIAAELEQHRQVHPGRIRAPGPRKPPCGNRVVKGRPQGSVGRYASR